MKKIFIALCLFAFTASMSWAAFAPQPMVIDAPSKILYDFDGTDVDIDFSVSGTDASVTLIVFTKDKADEIVGVQNGDLGWHYVNKIDTCVYVSEPKYVTVGDATITWDGTDQDGSNVASGEYTYYLWAFDSQGSKRLVTDQLSYDWNDRASIVMYDSLGVALAQPVIYKPPQDGDAAAGPVTIKKWVIGNEPTDDGLVETTSVMAYKYGYQMAIHPKNHNIFFDQSYNGEGLLFTRSHTWVPNGEALPRDEWGDGGETVINVANTPWNNSYAGLISNGDDILYTTNVDIYSQGEPMVSDLIYLDMETGDELRRVDLTEWWLYDWRNSPATEGPCDFSYIDGTLYTSCYFSYILAGLEPDRDDDEIFAWVNSNGDGYNDNRWEDPDDAFPFNYRGQMDNYKFGANPAYDLGSVSFFLIAPDGTGVNYFSFSGESANIKFGENFVYSGSAYDGIYTDNASAEADNTGWWYVAQDTFQGVISYFDVAVEDDAPAAFTVAQNSPNPFNPTTTIAFNIAEAGNVTVDVFNVAGQKVDTIADAYMSAGSHNVTWDASSFSAGVYFYTVKSGSHSETMKMTLLK